MKDQRPCIQLVDDHAIVRSSIAQMLESELEVNVCCEAATVEEALKQQKEFKLDLVITDITLPGKSGLELIKSLRVNCPDVPVLVLSMHDEKLYAERVLKLGAKGYIMKQEAPSRLLQAVREILAGKIYVSESMHETFLSMMSGSHLQTNSVAALTPHEIEILSLIGQGMSNAKIATSTNRSVKTVEFHRANIRRKLNLQDSHDLHHFAIQWLEAQPTP
jgi:DNA-binding NarL/FixJ family response regulator